MTSRTLLCPSAEPSGEDAAAIGVVQGDVANPKVNYFGRPAPATDELLALASPVAPTEVFRFSAACVESACSHYRDGACQIARRLVERMAPTRSTLPRCGVRGACRWWIQEGRTACERCDSVVTTNSAPTQTMDFVAGRSTAGGAGNDKGF
ncbi:MAG: nitrogen fixation protein [Pseudomonadota bacterium]